MNVGSTVELFNPHGTIDGDRIVYQKELHDAYIELQKLAKEKKLNKDRINEIITGYSAIQDKTKSIIGPLRAKINGLAATPVAEGFAPSNVVIAAKQTLGFSVVHEHFKKINLIKIK